jgi:ABC-type nitrate/sulfonate/bicarbonate transport system permease component
MWQRMDLLAAHALVTLTEIGLGFWLALVVGITLAVLIHSSRIIERSFLPLIISSQTIPVFAIAPLLILWFGYGIGSKVVMTAIIVFFPIVINTVEGLRAADPDTLALLKILEASPGQVFFKVRVPQSLPFVFSGIKIGVAVSVIGAVIGEWVGARKGLGYLMIHANAQLQVELVFASIFWLSILGMGLYGLVAVLERLLVPWRHGGSNK